MPTHVFHLVERTRIPSLRADLHLSPFLCVDSIYPTLPDPLLDLSAPLLLCFGLSIECFHHSTCRVRVHALGFRGCFAADLGSSRRDSTTTCCCWRVSTAERVGRTMAGRLRGGTSFTREIEKIYMELGKTK